jgi:hypothetical protein
VSADEAVTFSATLFRPEGAGTATFVRIPDNVMRVFATRARVPVAGTVNGFAFRGSLMPMGGAHLLCVNAQMRAGAKTQAGQTATIVLARDTAPRAVEVPDDLAQRFKRAARAGRLFAGLSYTHQKEYVEWITGAKKAETRKSRLDKTIEMLLAGKRTKST